MQTAFVRDTRTTCLSGRPPRAVPSVYGGDRSARPALGEGPRPDPVHRLLHTCTTTCKSENEVPVGVTRTYVKSVDIGTFPNIRTRSRSRAATSARAVRASVPDRCDVPSPGRHRRLRQVDLHGCEACMAACPYGTMSINPDDHSAEKCNLSAHRVDVGLEPACVTVCPTGAVLLGDPERPVVEGPPRSCSARPWRSAPAGEGDSSRPLLQGHTRRHSIRSPPGAVGRALRGRRGDRGAGYQWSRAIPVRTTGARRRCSPTTSPTSRRGNWRVSGYTFAKGLASGGFLVPLLLVLVGRLDWTDPLMALAAPSLGLVALAVTGVLLVWDLKHPMRFTMIFTRQHWRSWMVRGAFVARRTGPRWRRTAPRPGRPDRSRGRSPPRSGGRWPSRPPATPRTCSPRRRPATCGRARCSRRTSRCRPCWLGRPRRCRCGRLSVGRANGGGGRAGRRGGVHVVLVASR